MFIAQGMEVAAGVKQQLQADAKRVPGVRLLDGRFVVIQQALRLPKGRDNGARIHVTRDPFEAVRGASAVVTDGWVSMGDEDESRRHHNLLSPYQVNAKLMKAAAGDAIFMHCLPAHRGEEVTDEVMDGSQSVVFDEAENRLHAQKGVLAWCLAPLSA